MFKSKGLPRQAEVARGVPGSLRPRIFLTFQHYKGGSSSAKRTGRLYPRRNPWYSPSEADSTSGHMVLSGVPRRKSPVTPPGIDPGTSLLLAQCLNHYATPDPNLNVYWSVSYSMTWIPQIEILSWRWGHLSPPKQWRLCIIIHGIKYQRTVLYCLNIQCTGKLILIVKLKYLKFRP